MQNFVKSKQPARQAGLFGKEVKQVPARNDTEPIALDSDDSDSAEIQAKKKQMAKRAAPTDMEIDQIDSGQAPKVVDYIPWVEKYRPSKIDEVSHQVEVVKGLRESVKNGHIPHILMYGPPGTGKTSTVLALAKEMFGKTFYKHRILELNASDERGIAVVRDKIKKFAQRKISKNPEFDVPPIQIIILDEADSMTIDAQAALRRIIEAYSTHTRFCIICNYISKIIDPLASRCVKYRFSPVSFESQFDRLKFICEQEKIAIDSDDVLKALIEISDGDLRRSINTLQTCSSFIKVGSEEENVQPLSLEDIQKISGQVPMEVIEGIYEAVMKNSSHGGYTEIQELANNLILEGYDVQQLIVKLMQYFIDMQTDGRLKDIHKARISEIIAEADFSMIQGGDEELNLLNVLSSIAKTLSPN